MPRKKKNSQDEPIDLKAVEKTLELLEEEEEVKPVPVERKASSVGRKRTKKEKRMNFDSYARRKGFKDTHIPGLRAYAKNPNIPRTMEEWEKFFEKY